MPFSDRSHPLQTLNTGRRGKRVIGCHFQSFFPRCCEFPVFSAVVSTVRSLPGSRPLAAYGLDSAPRRSGSAHRFGETVTEVVITALVMPKRGDFRSSRSPDRGPIQGSLPLHRPLPPGVFRTCRLGRGPTRPQVCSLVRLQSFFNHSQPQVGGYRSFVPVRSQFS